MQSAFISQIEKYKSTYLSIALVACLLGSVADILLLYAASGNYHVGDYLFFKEISSPRLYWGHYLGIFAIPFQLFGFWILSLCFFPAGKNYPRLFFIAACFLIVIGVTYHGTLAFVGHLVQGPDFKAAQLEQIRNLLEPLSAILGVLFFIFIAIIFFLILKGKSVLPKWTLWFNPILWYLLFVLCYLFIPSIGNILIVAGFNLANFIFLLACYFALKNIALKT